MEINSFAKNEKKKGVKCHYLNGKGSTKGRFYYGCKSNKTVKWVIKW